VRATSALVSAVWDKPLQPRRGGEEKPCPSTDSDEFDAVEQRAPGRHTRDVRQYYVHKLLKWEPRSHYPTSGNIYPGTLTNSRKLTWT